MKAFYRQRVSEPSCARKETVDLDILGMVTEKYVFCQNNN